MNNPTPSRKYILLEPLMLALMVIVGIVIGYQLNETEDDYSLISKINDEELAIGRVEELLRFIENKYVYTLDVAQIQDQLINTVINELDPHSVYIPPKELEGINLQMDGKYLGIGIESFQYRDDFYISKVKEGSPASKAGLQRGMKILAVNDSIIQKNDFDYYDLADLIKQDKQVTLKVINNKTGEEQNILVETEEIDINTASASFRLDENTGYIRLERFTSNSYKEFMQSLELFIEEDKLENLVIDLRDNPGGFLPEVVKILSQLITEKERVLVFTEGENSPKMEYKTTGRAFFDINNVAVLINHGSASASEILAGAIQDWDRGIIVGIPSFGKGLVQEQYKLRNGGAVRLTVAEYFTPTGRLIQKPYDKKQYLSQNQEDLKDSSEVSQFKTLLLERPVNAGGGIEPDIFVEEEKNWDSDEFQIMLSHAKEQVFSEYVLSERGLEKKDFPLNEAKTNALLSFLKNDKRHSDRSLDMYKQSLISEINYFLAHIYFEDSFAAQMRSASDQTIAKAIEALKEKGTYSELLH